MIDHTQRNQGDTGYGYGCEGNFRAYILVDYVNPLAESSKVAESGYARGPSIVIFPVVTESWGGSEK
jgi:hypothetical protein